MDPVILGPNLVGGYVVDFDLQKFLGDMRRESQDAHQALTSKVDDGFARMAARADTIAANLSDHEKEDVKVAAGLESRLEKLDEMRTDAKWFARTAIAALVLFIVDLIKNHWFLARPPS